MHTSDFTPASSEQFTILGFVGDTNYVDQAYEALMNQCSGGVITGITTQYSTSFGFFSWTNKILTQGLFSNRNPSGRRGILLMRQAVREKVDSLVDRDGSNLGKSHFVLTGVR